MEKNCETCNNQKFNETNGCINYHQAFACKNWQPSTISKMETVEPIDKTLEYFKSVLDTIFEQTGTAKDFKIHGEKIPLFEKALISLWSEHCKVVDEYNDLKEQWQREAWEAARELHPYKFAERKWKTFEDWNSADAGGKEGE